MIATLVNRLPEYELPALVFRALLDKDDICDAPPEHPANEIGSGKSNGRLESNNSRQGVPAYSNNARFA
jgi:hypothetical protein